MFLCWGLFILEWLSQEEREGEILQTFPAGRQIVKRKGGKEGEGAEILPVPPLPAAGGESQRAVGGRHLAVFQELLLLFPKATCTDFSDAKGCRRRKGGCSCTERGSGGEELFALCSQTLWYLGRSLWYLGR